MTSKKALASTILLTLVATLSLAAVPQESGSSKHEITAVDLKKRLDKNQKTIILDSRGSVSGQTIKGAVHVPTSEVADWAKSAEKDSFIVTFCTCPHDEAAEASVAKLRDLGFKNSFSLKGGLNAAIQAGIPTAEVSE